MDAFEAEIARERERREELESELDQMRKRLRESLTLIEHYQSIDSTSFTVRVVYLYYELELDGLSPIAE